MAGNYLLPLDLIELQIGQIDLLLAMYPEEVVLEEQSQKTIEAFRDSGITSLGADHTEFSTVSIVFRLPVTSQSQELKTLELDLTVPFTYEGVVPPEEPPRIRIRVRQPAWLSKAATNQLLEDLPEDEDLLGAIEYIKDVAGQYLEQANEASASSSRQETSTSLTDGIVRVWFYFPSISTRSKRDDFIIHAPSYNLTGFLYAGKPGLLCVEGTSKAIDDYMKFIKTESWGDIPAHHKKVSERYRESDGKNGGVERAFKDMTEITDLVGERRGQRANRGDMKAMEEWLVERGLGEAFTKVLM